ncbi:MAG: SUMF1/EgtB/PvdO family nonheme iron enzyme [Planctomycetota bacterium]|nr:SUMF1/EgtB/PvdO family nonheme iron enzyme [Planctomycetota bacterium]
MQTTRSTTVRTDRHVLPTALLAGVALAVPFAIAAPSADGVAEDPTPTPRPRVGEAWIEPVPGTAIELSMRPVPGPDDQPLWVMEKELTWNLFDIFIFRLDEKKGNSTPGSDAVTRPTKPYIAVDRGFGHDGYPAISMSLKGAIQFADWLSEKTGRTYRVPTVEQWSRICAAASIPDESLEEYAWFVDDSGDTTHPVGTKKADALGLHDLYGNVGEWCLAGGTPEKPVGVLMGGDYQSDGPALDCAHQVDYDPMWNDSDPQFPKSIWWLADAAFVGVRLVCVDAGGNDASAPATSSPTPEPASPGKEPAKDAS